MITAVVPISPIKQHPNTSIVEETINSIRYHHPTAEIMLLFDGVRAEQEHRRRDYERAIQRILWLADKRWRNCYPTIFDGHRHQVGMMRHILGEIRTPLLLFVEQDTPIVVDEPINWDAITKYILDGQSNMVRLHHEATILEAHQHLMHGIDGEFALTSQYSARPHIASVAFYERLLTHFSPQAKCFLEDNLYGVISTAYERHGMLGWDQHRLHIWHPDTGNIKRSVHLDGRAGESKYDTRQTF